MHRYHPSGWGADKGVSRRAQFLDCRCARPAGAVSRALATAALAAAALAAALSAALPAAVAAALAATVALGATVAAALARRTRRTTSLTRRASLTSYIDTRPLFTLPDSHSHAHTHTTRLTLILRHSHSHFHTHIHTRSRTHIHTVHRASYIVSSPPCADGPLHLTSYSPRPRGCAALAPVT